MGVEPNIRRAELMQAAFAARDFELTRDPIRIALVEQATAILLDEALGYRLRDGHGQDYVPRLQMLKGHGLEHREPRIVRAITELTKQPWSVTSELRWMKHVGPTQLPGSGRRVIVPGG